jgi:hypothetical protein
VEGDEAGEDARHIGEGNHVRAVAEGVVGIWMRLDENTRRAGGDGTTREDGSEFALAGGFIAAAAR